MADILIRGVSMLDTGNYFAMVENETQHQPNVTIWKRKTDGSLERFGFGEVVELPEHGDLIDRKSFREEMDKHYPFDRGTQRRHGEADAAKSTVINMLANAPVIVPSSKEETE